MTFGITWTDVARFQRVDEMIIGNHYHLNGDDECYFLIEFTSHMGYEYSAANSLILNLKKKPSLRSTNQWQHKIRAMDACSDALKQAINPEWLKTATLVPVPPSKKTTDSEYDDRIEKICRGIQIGFDIDIRNLVIQTESYEASHGSDYRITVDELLAIYEIDDSVAEPAPTAIAIVDDVLTAGVHYRAMHTVLSGRFPDVPIIGIFVARRVFPDPAEDF